LGLAISQGDERRGDRCAAPDWRDYCARQLVSCA
jgi:hypothetical protein